MTVQPTGHEAPAAWGLGGAFIGSITALGLTPAEWIGAGCAIAGVIIALLQLIWNKRRRDRALALYETQVRTSAQRGNTPPPPPHL